MEKFDREKLAGSILDRISPDRETLKLDFDKSKSAVGVRHCLVDNLLPEEIADAIYRAFPKPESMRLMNSFREKKYTSKSFEEFDPLMAEITFAVQDRRIVDIFEYITGINNQMPDSSLYAGGLSAMPCGHHLGPHIDNSHDGKRSNYRTLNLLYYITPDWSLEDGGNLELWDQRVREKVTIVSRYNRLVIMETTPVSWHSVSAVRVHKVRNCVSNYYFSPQSPTGVDYFNVTSFRARPEQPFRRVLARFDNGMRRVLRAIVPHGVGKKDVYQGSQQ